MFKPLELDKIMSSTIFKVFCIVDPIVGVTTFFFKENKYVAPIFYIAVAIMCIIGIVLAFKYARFVKTEKENNLLIKHIHSGIKYTQNEAVVTLEKQQNQYHFQFNKEFEIISDNAPAWYSAQFYANKILKDTDETKQYYETNIINWKDLKVRALISYKLPESDDFTKWQKLKIYNISDKSNYIPFNIQYVTKDNRVLNLVKGTKVKLQYCYDVPTKFWGSYLNRRISFFNEETTVKLKYETDFDLNINVSMFSKDSGEQVDANGYYTIAKEQENQYDVSVIKFKSKPFAKYRVWWDSSAYFNNDVNTQDVADKSQFTDN